MKCKLKKDEYGLYINSPNYNSIRANIEANEDINSILYRLIPKKSIFKNIAVYLLKTFVLSVFVILSIGKIYEIATQYNSDIKDWIMIIYFVLTLFLAYFVYKE